MKINKNTKKQFASLLFVMMLNIIAFGQAGQDHVEIPQSPEAQAMVNYGNVPVSLYTGTPNISVPLYTVKGREIEIPISLSYDASGVKVEQISTSVGLGWSLNTG